MIKCKHSVEGLIMSQMFNLLYSNGKRDVSKVEIIQKYHNIIGI